MKQINLPTFTYETFMPFVKIKKKKLTLNCALDLIYVFDYYLTSTSTSAHFATPNTLFWAEFNDKLVLCMLALTILFRWCNTRTLLSSRTAAPWVISSWYHTFILKTQTLLQSQILLLHSLDMHVLASNLSEPNCFRIRFAGDVKMLCECILCDGFHIVLRLNKWLFCLCLSRKVLNYDFVCFHYQLKLIQWGPSELFENMKTDNLRSSLPMV